MLGGFGAGSSPTADFLAPRQLVPLAADPVGICQVVSALVVQLTDAQSLDLAPGRFDENQIRSTSELLRRLFALDPAPVTIGRGPAERIVGTCRHFAVLSCALLRYRGISARVRWRLCYVLSTWEGSGSLDHRVLGCPQCAVGSYRLGDPRTESACARMMLSPVTFSAAAKRGSHIGGERSTRPSSGVRDAELGCRRDPWKRCEGSCCFEQGRDAAVGRVGSYDRRV